MLEAFVHDPLINWRLLNTTEPITEAALGRESQEAAAAAAGGGAPGAAGGVAVGGAAAGAGPGAVLTSTTGAQVRVKPSGHLQTWHVCAVAARVRCCLTNAAAGMAPVAVLTSTAGAQVGLILWFFADIKW
jgi:hypothetical protein